MKAPKKKKPEVEIPTSSLADIVFLLLIFFLVTTSMNPDKGLGLTLPPQGEKVEINKKNILPIYVNKKGSILIREDVLPLEQVKARVEKEIKQNDKLVVSLNTDPDATYDMMIKVLDQLKLAHATRISLATPEF